MGWSSWLKHERRLWHKHFMPSLIAGVIVAALSYAYQATISSIILFASVGASATILTHAKSHHLTRLRTTLGAYLIAIVISLCVYGLNQALPLHISVNIFLLVFLVGIALFLLDVFHPPAITASLSFILLDRPLIDLLYLFCAILLLFIGIRFLTYVLSQHLPVGEFFQEFCRHTGDGSAKL
ncbi:HPP family protein [Candidatus Woesearchaeota archaeon]|nr:HPP family protein [Candidatus Woesearchaeota archaeon]